MNLPVLVAVAEIVSALAVTFTLIALIVSIRQNTKSQRALVVDSLAAAIASINVPAMESHALGSALAKATADWGSASREERIMAHYFLFLFPNCQRTPGTKRGRESLIRHSGLDGKHCFESIITAMAYARHGGRAASTHIRQSSKTSFPEQSRRRSLVV